MRVMMSEALAIAKKRNVAAVRKQYEENVVARYHITISCKNSIRLNHLITYNRSTHNISCSSWFSRTNKLLFPVIDIR